MSDWPPFDDTGETVDDEDVMAFEKENRRCLPEDYRSFLVDVNGGFATPDHCRFRLRDGHSTLNTLYSLDADDERDDLQTRNHYAHDIPDEGIVIGYGDSGNIILIVVGKHYGEVWHLTRGMDGEPHAADARTAADELERELGIHDNDANDWFDRRDVAKLADSFTAFIAGLGPIAEPA